MTNKLLCLFILFVYPRGALFCTNTLFIEYDVRNDNKDKLYSLSLCLDVKYMRHRLLLFKNVPIKRQVRLAVTLRL